MRTATHRQSPRRGPRQNSGQNSGPGGPGRATARGHAWDRVQRLCGAGPVRRLDTRQTQRKRHPSRRKGGVSESPTAARAPRSSDLVLRHLHSFAVLESRLVGDDAANGHVQRLNNIHQRFAVLRVWRGRTRSSSTRASRRDRRRPRPAEAAGARRRAGPSWCRGTPCHPSSPSRRTRVRFRRPCCGRRCT